MFRIDKFLLSKTINFYLKGRKKVLCSKTIKVRRS